MNIDEKIDIIKKIDHRGQVGLLIKNLNNPTICEVGVRLGDYFDFLLTDNVKTAIGVDIWNNTDKTGQNDSLYNQEELNIQYKKVFQKYYTDTRVKLIREFSKNACSFFDDETFDFIYIDADHTYDAVMEDLESWYPKVKKGGVLSGHDYISGDRSIIKGHSVRFGVVEAVADFRNKYLIEDKNFHLTNEEYATYYIIKE